MIDVSGKMQSNIRQTVIRYCIKSNPIDKLQRGLSAPAPMALPRGFLGEDEWEKSSD
jgi:hypothetical protein